MSSSPLRPQLTAALFLSLAFTLSSPAGETLTAQAQTLPAPANQAPPPQVLPNPGPVAQARPAPANQAPPPQVLPNPGPVAQTRPAPANQAPPPQAPPGKQGPAAQPAAAKQAPAAQPPLGKQAGAAQAPLGKQAGAVQAPPGKQGPAVQPAATMQAPAAPLSPASRYLLVGGGRSPYNTQVSLEEHLLRLQQLLRARGVPSARRPLLFADGPTGNPVVELYDARPAGADTLLDDLAFVTGHNSNRGVTWRATKLTEIVGPATLARLESAFGDREETTRTLLYFAGHGHQDPDNGDVYLSLWNDERLTPPALARWLDPLPADHRLVLVLSQCHSGGFGDLLFREGNPDHEITDSDRCGFFAAPRDYPSSGCTAEANRTNPDDFSTWFFSALDGQLPGGRPLPSSPDFDDDGRVTLNEAMGFARLNDGTLDVPNSTSEYYLRYATAELELTDDLTLGSPFVSILKAARPAERAILEQLAAQLKVDTDPGAAMKARYEADRLATERYRLLDRAGGLSDERDAAREQLERDFIARWPWLGNQYHPRSSEVVQRNRTLIQAFVKNHPQRATMSQLDHRIGALNRKVHQLEERWARWERLARAAEAVVMEAQLRAKGSPEQVRKLEQLLRCEGDTL